jgi:hypothetical protein
MGAAMEPFRLKMKIGAHEFEAEGDQDTVERQFAIWREMIAASPSLLASPPPATDPGPALGEPPTAQPRREFGKIFRHEGRVVSLSALPTNGSPADAALLLMLGQQAYNNEALITGNQLIQGMARSGLPVPRVDRVFGEHMGTNVIRVGVHRAVRYRLTNPGVARATEMAVELAGTVP